MRALLVMTVAMSWTCNARAQAEDHQEVIDELALREALLNRVEVWRRSDGRAQYVAHCERAPVGCMLRVSAFARWFVRAGERHRVDPWLLAAMAVRESSLNPSARGSVGEFGLMQLHPYSSVGYKTRAECKRAPSDCTWLVIDAAAELVASSLKRCGDISRALTAYNRGACGDSFYARQVLRERERLVGGVEALAVRRADL
jgi:hypothetical protein